MYNEEDPFYAFDRERIEKEKQFQKLCDDPSSKIPCVGDRVVVAAGLIGMGFNWVRKEATVLEVGETSYRVQFQEKRLDGTPMIQWIHPALITDVLENKE